MKTLGIILARGGSKRLPGKNALPLRGIPLVGWTILAAQNSSLLSCVALSSDSEKILDAGRRCGILTIRRPDELATDTASPYDAIKHAYLTIGRPFDFICLLQPTSPLRTAEDIDACLNTAYTTELPAVVSHEERCPVANGAVYVGRTEWLLDGGNFDRGPALPYYMPPERSVDINTLDEFNLAAKYLGSVQC